MNNNNNAHSFCSMRTRERPESEQRRALREPSFGGSEAAELPQAPLPKNGERMSAALLPLPFYAHNDNESLWDGARSGGGESTEKFTQFTEHVERRLRCRRRCSYAAAQKSNKQKLLPRAHQCSARLYASVCILDARVCVCVPLCIAYFWQHSMAALPAPAATPAATHIAGTDSDGDSSFGFRLGLQGN